jgi:hypothetical protein
MTRQYRKKSYDVVVIGGGLAGVCAAIAAARHGATVGFIQDRPVLGGNSSSEIRVPINGAQWGGPPYRNRHARETGIIDEIWMDYCIRNPEKSHSVRDLILLEHVLAEKRIDLHLNYRACDVVMRDTSTIAAVRAEPIATETPVELEAGLFIDASGDGWVAAMAGAEFRHGREGQAEFGESLAPAKPDDFTLGSSIYFTVKDTGRPVKFAAPHWARKFPTCESLNLRRHDNPLNHELFWWIEYGGTLDTIADADRIYRELIAVVMGIWDHIKNSGLHDAETLALDWIGKVPGRRESRRFLGDHILVQSDVDDRVLFDDRVAYGGWWLDQHTPGGVLDVENPPCDKSPPVGKIYSVPMRCLYSRNVSNLLFAGRHISASHVAHSSTRVMRTLAVIGQASGTAAALCVRHRCAPRELTSTRIRELQQTLLRDDVYIIGLASDDPNDLARSGKASATSEWKPPAAEAEAFGHSDFGARNVLSGIARPEAGKSSNLWVSDPSAGLPQELTVELGRPAEIGRVELRFDTCLELLHFVEPPRECVRDYDLDVRSDGKWTKVHGEAGNVRRFRAHDFAAVRADAVRLRVTATHGDASARVHELRVYPPGK